VQDDAWGPVALSLTFLLLRAFITDSTDSGTAQPQKTQITILYDAFGPTNPMQKDWGYAALIEFGGKRILFDSGNNPETLAHNAQVKGVDLSRLDFVVMSHRHGDHMGGLSFVLKMNPKVRIYAPKEGFGVYGGDLPGSFYRRDSTLPTDQRYFSGAAPEVMRFGSAWPGANFELIDKTTEIAPNMHLIALVSEKPGTLELRELSLALNTPDGMVIVVGCSHPGIDQIIEAARVFDQRIHLVTGGFHLVIASDQDIEKTVSALHENFRVDYVAPGHCTGEPAFAALKKAFGGRYVYAGLGSQIVIGPEVRSEITAVGIARE
jgi:7,8-dihydropterin-6-yl-methyl-4-(beta-D-ribofuranosyl)aminobenzene 5'-phosphate synthase